MKKWTRTAFKYTIQLSMAGLLFGQASSGYLAQKLMIENSLRTRISDALEKDIENRKYVIDVSVDLELSSAVENQTTYSPNGNAFESLQSVEGSLSRDEMANPGSVGLPIPGFDFTGENQQTNTATAQDSPMDSQQSENVVSRTQTEMRPSMASVSNMEISIILQEGAAPELIENIRQVVMVASRFNRTRGDVLSIMTASFRERRDEKSAETVLLKNIAEKLESLESQRERLGEVDWKQELENYKQNEEERRQEDRLYFQSQLAELESSARDQSYNQERQAMLRQDSIRLQTLNEEIQNLKSFLGADNISESEMAEAQNTVQEKLVESYHSHRFNINMLPRQTGKSTTAAGYLLWYAMFNPDVTVLIAAHKYQGAQEIMHRIRYAYELCPDYIRCGVTSYNKGSMEFDNGSRIVSQTTTDNTGRGMSISLLYCDEFAFVNLNIAKEFWTSI